MLTNQLKTSSAQLGNITQAGHFYAVGIGPGSADLLTIRAAQLIEQCDVVMAPQSNISAKSLALEAVQPFLNQQEIVTISYPMERNAAQTRSRWHDLAGDIAKRCTAGQSVVQITLGDPLIFATSSYLLQALTTLLPSEQIHVVPGISAFQTTASRFAEALTLQEDRLTLMSATDLNAVEAALDNCETLVLYKAGGCMNELITLLRQRKLLKCASFVSCGEQGEHELIVADLENWQPLRLNYMTTMIIKIGHRCWNEK